MKKKFDAKEVLHAMVILSTINPSVDKTLFSKAEIKVWNKLHSVGARGGEFVADEHTVVTYED